MIGNAEQLLKYLFNVDKTKVFEIKEVKKKPIHLQNLETVFQ